MAKEGGHGKCAVKGGTVFDCKGPVKRVPWAAYNEPPPVKGSIAPPPKQADNPRSAEPSQPPATVEEMAKRANESTAEQIKQANEDVKAKLGSFGQKVGDTTKKTWNCIASLFTRCKE